MRATCCRAALAAVTVLLLAAGTAGAKQISNGTATGKSFARRLQAEVAIPRFAEIRPGLSRGGEPGENGIRYLHTQGYRTVLSFLTDSAESTWVVNSGMRWIHIPMRSGLFSAQPPTQEQVRQFLSVVTDSTQYPVFIHCHAGKDRTGAMSAIYRMEACGWTKEEAMAEMDAFGFSGRYRRLRAYVETYPGASSTTVARSAPAGAVPSLEEGTAGTMAPLSKTAETSTPASSAPASSAPAPVGSSR